MRFFHCSHPSWLIKYLYKLAGVEHYQCTRCGATIKKRITHV